MKHLPPIFATLFSILGILLLLNATNANAELLYRCLDDKGGVTYTNIDQGACADRATEIIYVPNEKTVTDPVLLAQLNAASTPEFEEPAKRAWWDIRGDNVKLMCTAAAIALALLIGFTALAIRFPLLWSAPFFFAGPIAGLIAIGVITYVRKNWKTT